MHPTFLYELLWNLAVAGLVVWADRRFRLGHGRAFAVYVAGYTAGRFFIEQMRTDYATRVFGDLRINVVVSAVVFVGAVLYLLLVRRPREVLPTAADAGSESPTGDGELVPVAAGSRSGLGRGNGWPVRRGRGYRAPPIRPDRRGTGRGFGRDNGAASRRSLGSRWRGGHAGQHGTGLRRRAARWAR